jgi:hypothetical protein
MEVRLSGQPITVLMVNEYPDYIDAEVWADGLAQHHSDRDRSYGPIALQKRLK